MNGMLKNTDMLVTGNLENRRRWQEGITYNAVMFRETRAVFPSDLFFTQDGVRSAWNGSARRAMVGKSCS